jgi:predicted nucleotidyltransferase
VTASWPDFDPGELLSALTGRGVDFVVVGGIGAVLLGSPRLTRDLDITFAPDPLNLESLGEVLVELGAQLKGVEDDVPFVADAATLRRVQVLTLTTRAGEIDLLAEPEGGPGYQKLRKRAERINVGDVTVLVASIEDLISMKQAAGRPKDLADLEELETIRRLRRRPGPC